MDIGIIGLGLVGETLQYGFRRIGHTVTAFDILLPDTSLQDVLRTEVIFICVPTPSKPDGACDVSIVERVVGDLARAEYKGLAVIKSTVIPGTTDRLQSKYPNLDLAFCPEFLREKSRYSDFVEQHDVCVIGVTHQVHAGIITEAHGSFPRNYAIVEPIEAELTKYFSNCFNAARIVFANEFYDVCQVVGADYQAVKDAISKRDSIRGDYLDCSESFRGFGGNCLPKDTKAFAKYVKGLGLNLKLFEQIVSENGRYV